VAALVPRDWNIIIGSALASKLDVVLGDKVTVVAPKGQVTPAGLLPRLKRFRVAGIFELGMYEYDSALALIHIEDAARLFRTEGRATGLRLKLKDVYDAPRVRQELIELLGSGVGITDWTREHSNLFRALKIEKRVMFIILLLIVAVAAFNIVSTLIMVVADKEADVAILRTLGISPLSVMGIFVVQGVMIGITGTLLGTGVGVLTPCTTKIPITLNGLMPRVRNMATSASLSATTIIKVETILNAATATMSKRIMNMTRFSIFSARKRLLCSRVQSVMPTPEPSSSINS
jgi:lipoprotein-releasing system permease protein